MSQIVEFLKNVEIVDKYFTKLNTNIILRSAKIIVFYFSSINDVNNSNLLILTSLKRMYKISKEKGLRMEIIFVPTDDNESDMKECFKKQGDWYGLPFDSPIIQTLIHLFETTGTPGISVIKKNGELVTKNGITDLTAKRSNAIVNWL